MDSLDVLMAPRSIAVIGASADPERVGGRPITKLLKSGFAGPIYPVNPGRKEIQGLTVYPSIRDVPGPVDCAILTIPSALVMEELRACAEVGVRSAVVFTAGFAEVGGEGRLMQEEMTRISRESGMRIMGPNTVGAYNSINGAYLTFSSLFMDERPKYGRIGIASQSGGYATYIAKAALDRGLPVTHLAATGNEADIQVGDVLHWMAHSPDIDVIVSYVEGLRSPQTFLDGLKEARRRGKPVIVIKVGSSEQGAEAASSHTAALAGSDTIYDAVLREHGVWRAQTTTEALDIAYAASCGILPKNNSLCILTSSGGFGIQMVDHATRAGMSVPPPSEAAQARIMELCPFGAPRNPVDVTAQVNFGNTVQEQVLDRVLQDGIYGSVVCYNGVLNMSDALTRDYIEMLKRIRAKHPDILLCVAVLASEELRREFFDAGFPVYADPAMAVHVTAALARIGHNLRTAEDNASPDPATMPDLGGRIFNEADGKALLQDCGIAIPREAFVLDAAQARTAAATIPAPYALKVVSRDLPHKSDVGGVALGLGDGASLAAELDAMRARVAAARPDAAIEGFLVSEMVSGGVECIVGASRDPLFGPVVMFGLGGTAVEIMADVAFHTAPVSKPQALEIIRSVRSFPLLDGHRGAPKGDIEALADVIVKIAALAAANPEVEAIELNPVLVRPAGEGVVTLDVNIQQARGDGTA